MSRSLKIDISERDTYEFDRGDQLPDWLSRFAEDFAEAEERHAKTAVEVARERTPSVTERIHSIMNGRGNSYSSVEEAVEDYQKRTGLLEYARKATAEEVSKAAKIILAGDDGDEKKADEPEDDAPAEENERPVLFVKQPAIESFIHNLIETNHAVQLPAILFGILELFARDGIRETDVDDSALAKHINKLIMSKRQLKDNNDARLGRGVGTRTEHEIRDQNTQAFVGLIPNRGMW